MTRWKIRPIIGGFALYLDGSLAAVSECPCGLFGLVITVQQEVPA